jgi:anti-sigma factor (TIGR02949 family)
MKHIHDPQIRCEEVLRQLFAYLDREIDPRTAALIERHLEACRGCFSRAAFERKLKAQLRAAAEEPAPARLRSRIKNIVDRF